MQPQAESNPRPLSIPRSEKQKRLSIMLESEFRDRIVRPVFLAHGYSDGRDVHGADEEGKDLVFVDIDRFGRERVICVQTKRGNLNMAAKHNKNISNVATQLNMALATQVSIVERKRKYYPSEIFLCASGTINTRARNYITSELSSNTQIHFLDGDSLIDLIDKKCPELWHGITIDVFAHYDAIRKHVESTSSDAIGNNAANDETFVQLRLYRETLKRKKHSGQIYQEVELEELTVPQLMARPPGITLVVGEAGSGKSTALWRFAYEIVRRDAGRGERIPVVISARTMDLQTSEVANFIAEVRQEAQDFSRASEFLFDKNDIADGRVVVLIDGLDEITDLDTRKRLCELIHRIRDQYPLCTIVVTTRPDREITSLFPESSTDVYHVAPISWRQVTKIVKQVLARRKLVGREADVLANGARRVLRRIEEVHGFQLTPLLATVYAASAEHTRSDVPANITELFKKYTELMLGRWDEKKGLSQQIQAPLKDFLLQKVAYHLHIDEQLSMTEEDFRGMVSNLLTERGYHLEVNEIVDELLERSHLLQARGTEVAFSHHLLQEFFAGRELAPDDVASHIDEPWWTKPIVFHYGDRADGARHLRGVQERVLNRKTQTPISHRTIGLALQSSYLSLVEDRKQIWWDVVASISRYTVDYVLEDRQDRSFPFTGMAFTYLNLRDAVPFSALGEDSTRTQIMDALKELPDNDHQRIAHDALRFWVIVSLLESGLIREAADTLTRRFFDDKRYYFWIYMGASFIHRILPVSDSQKRYASSICKEYEELARPFIQEFSKEYRTLLLEEREGKIVEVPEE